MVTGQVTWLGTASQKFAQLPGRPPCAQSLFALSCRLFRLRGVTRPCHQHSISKTLDERRSCNLAPSTCLNEELLPALVSCTTYLEHLETVFLEPLCSRSCKQSPDVHLQGRKRRSTTKHRRVGVAFRHVILDCFVTRPLSWESSHKGPLPKFGFCLPQPARTSQCDSPFRTTSKDRRLDSKMLLCDAGLAGCLVPVKARAGD
jgi:hypothetical protein